MRNRALVLLSGEASEIPQAEAKALFLSQDPEATFRTVERRLLLADSVADPYCVGSRVAYARRVGVMVDGPDAARQMIEGHSARVRVFDLVPGLPKPDEGRYLEGLEVKVDLMSPELELTVVRGEETHFAVTKPMSMRQGWSRRRPRQRSFFHPSAMFPKLARMMVNLSRCRAGEVFLDPFAGTGSLAIEAAVVGALPVTIDRSWRMASGSLLNMKQQSQTWLGVLRADAFRLPVRTAGAAATDVPYGRAASTRGKSGEAIMRDALSELPTILPRGSRLVIMHSQDSKAQSTGELEVEDEFHLYVHKLLTRTITVMRRR